MVWQLARPEHFRVFMVWQLARPEHLPLNLSLDSETVLLFAACGFNEVTFILRN
jgi:hypothetical protein